jgi:hypothetical protein
MAVLKQGVPDVKVTRRSLGRILAAAAAVAPGGADAQTTEANEDLQSARDQIRANESQIAKVKLPVATEPAFHFKA